MMLLSILDSAPFMRHLNKSRMAFGTATAFDVIDNFYIKFMLRYGLAGLSLAFFQSSLLQFIE